MGHMTCSPRRQLLLVLAASPLLRAQGLPGIFSKLGKKPAPEGDKLVQGLRQALEIGLTTAVNLVARPDGYFANALIKILMPEQLRPMERALRLIGFAPKVDEFILGMNRAAEQAAPAARGIFLDAIKSITFADARTLLASSETAITEFFQTTTASGLVAAFRPPVREAMQSVGVIRSFQTLVDRFQKVPFAKKQNFDLETYVVTKAVDGLFRMVAEEEKNIRRNPAARVTAILQEVFGNLPGQKK